MIHACGEPAHAGCRHNESAEHMQQRLLRLWVGLTTFQKFNRSISDVSFKGIGGGAMLWTTISPLVSVLAVGNILLYTGTTSLGQGFPHAAAEYYVRGVPRH